MYTRFCHKIFVRTFFADYPVQMALTSKELKLMYADAYEESYRVYIKRHYDIKM